MSTQTSSDDQDSSKSSPNPELVQVLEWDSKFFGFPVAQITHNRLSADSMQEIQLFCVENDIRLLQFKCDAHHQPSVLIAEKHGFHFADVRMTYNHPLEGNQITSTSAPDNISFRLGVEEDIPELQDIATDLYTHSRYHFDNNFPQEQVRNFYRGWIRKAVLGTFDDLAMVVCSNDKPVGFCSVRFGNNNQASIGLVGVNPEYVGLGLGKGVIQKTLQMVADKGLETVNIVTQGRNYSAQNLYQRSGFLIRKIELYYHLWVG